MVELFNLKILATKITISNIALLTAAAIYRKLRYNTTAHPMYQ